MRVQRGDLLNYLKKSITVYFLDYLLSHNLSYVSWIEPFLHGWEELIQTV